MEENLNLDNNNPLISNNKNDINNIEEEIFQKNKDFSNNYNELYIIPPENIGFKDDNYENSNIFSKLFFYWGFKILKLTSKFKIEASHLGKLVQKNDSKYYYNDINYYWEIKGYRKYKKIRLIRDFFKANIIKIILIFLLISFDYLY